MEEDKTSTQAPPTPVNTIKDAAQTLLAHLLKFVHDFPSTLGIMTLVFFEKWLISFAGPEVVSSQIDEADDRDPIVNGSAVFTTYGENMLISICEVPNADKAKPNLARFFVRDPMGRYAWNFGIHFIAFWIIHLIIVEIIYNNENLPQKQPSGFATDHGEIVIDNEIFKYNSGTPSDDTNQVETIAPPPDKLDELLARWLPSTINWFYFIF